MGTETAKRTGCRGQALTEFALSTLVATTAFAGISQLAWAEWNRVRCAYQVFEAAHDRLIGRASLSKGPWDTVRIEETDGYIRGVGRCGTVTEEIQLPRLEPKKLKN